MMGGSEMLRVLEDGVGWWGGGRRRRRGAGGRGGLRLHICIVSGYRMMDNTKAAEERKGRNEILQKSNCYSYNMFTIVPPFSRQVGKRISRSTPQSSSDPEQISRVSPLWLPGVPPTPSNSGDKVLQHEDCSTSPSRARLDR